MTSPWSVPIFTNLTIPSSAGPGMARIVIASELPPPLDTYVTTEGPYSGAIIFYGEGDDTTYNYYGIVEDSLAQTVITHQGSVVNGAVVENSAQDPRAIKQYADSLGQRLRLSADTIELLASGLVPLAGLSITAADGNLTLTASLGSVVINSDIDWASSTQEDDLQTGSLQTSGTGYALLGTVTAGAVCGTAFIAPPSGKVTVMWKTVLDNSTAGNFAFCSAEVRQGSVVGAGAVVMAAADTNSAHLQGTDQIAGMCFYPLTGLTPGDAYNVSLWQRTNNAANVASFADRRVSVTPEM